MFPYNLTFRIWHVRKCNSRKYSCGNAQELNYWEPIITKKWFIITTSGGGYSITNQAYQTLHLLVQLGLRWQKKTPKNCFRVSQSGFFFWGGGFWFLFVFWGVCFYFVCLFACCFFFFFFFTLFFVSADKNDQNFWKNTHFCRKIFGEIFWLIFQNFQILVKKGWLILLDFRNFFLKSQNRKSGLVAPI